MTQGPSTYPIGQAARRLKGLGEKLRVLRQAQESADETDRTPSVLASIDAAERIVKELSAKLRTLEGKSDEGDPAQSDPSGPDFGG